MVTTRAMIVVMATKHTAAVKMTAVLRVPSSFVVGIVSSVALASTILVSRLSIEHGEMCE